jgi:hypothetical protein
MTVPESMTLKSALYLKLMAASITPIHLPEGKYECKFEVDHQGRVIEAIMSDDRGSSLYFMRSSAA